MKTKLVKLALGLLGIAVLPCLALAFSPVSYVQQPNNYGNLVASTAPAANISSMSVTVSGYTHYLVQFNILPNASNSTIFLRINNDSASDYAYDLSGFNVGTSSGIFCGHTAANHIALSLINNVDGSQSLYTTCVLNIDQHGYAKVYGYCGYVTQTSLHEVNISVAGQAHNTPITSIQVWAGSFTSCTSVTDPSNGTTGSMAVWGVSNL